MTKDDLVQPHSLSMQEQDVSCLPHEAARTPSTTEADEKGPPGRPEDGGHDANSWTFYCIIGCLLMGTFLIALDETILSPAIPKITSEFHALDDISWYGAGYLVTITALQPTFGKLYTFHDVKYVYLTCIFVFEAGSLVCGFAPTSTVLIIGRAIAGCGGAGILQGALAIITRTVPLEKRPQYIGVILSAFIVCVCIGPIIGGAFADDVTWRWCFFINVPIGGAVFIAIALVLKIPASQTNKDFQSLDFIHRVKEYDLPGMILIVSTTVCLLLALQWGGVQHPWKSGTIIGLFITAGVILAFFCYWQWRLGPKATIPFAIMRIRSVYAGAIFIFFFIIPTYVYGYFVPIYFQSARGFDPIEAAVRFLAIAIPQIFSVALVGGLTSKLGYYVPFLISGNVVAIVGSGFITIIGIETRTAIWAVTFVFYALGAGLAQNVPYTAIQVCLKEADVPTGNAIIQFFQQLGASIGLSIGQSIFINSLKSAVAARDIPVEPADVLRAGAYNIASLSSSPDVIAVIRQAYAEALRKTYIFPLIALCVALPVALRIEHKNIKREAKIRAE